MFSKTDVIDLFQIFDVDGGGDIDREEFIGGCHRAGFGESNFGFEDIYSIICDEKNLNVEKGLSFDDCLEAARTKQFVKMFVFYFREMYQTVSLQITPLFSWCFFKVSPDPLTVGDKLDLGQVNLEKTPCSCFSETSSVGKRRKIFT